MQLSAISHRPDSEDAFLYDKDHLRIRLHTAKNDIKLKTGTCELVNNQLTLAPGSGVVLIKK